MGLKIAEQVQPLSKILLIDDDLDQHSLINVALQHEFSLTFESSGSNAVSMALKEKPDLILLDLSMPHIDGFEVLEQFKRHPTLASIPVFCLSASTDEQTRARCYAVGASGFVKKPINIKTLASDVQKTLSNLSNTLTSDDKKSSVFVGQNDTELCKYFQSTVSSFHKLGKRIITLSVRDGVFYANESINKLVETHEVIYLQIKPSLMTRLPFIDDLSLVLSDLKKLLDSTTEDCILIVDRPELVLLSPSNDNKTATILAFSEAMSKNFSEVHYLCRKPSSAFEVPAMTEMSRLLARHY